MSDNKYLSAVTCIYHGFYAARSLSFLKQLAYSLAGEKGFEPLHDGIKTRCRNRLATPPCKHLKACYNGMLVYRILLQYPNFF